MPGERLLDLPVQLAGVAPLRDELPLRAPRDRPRHPRRQRHGQQRDHGEQRGDHHHHHEHADHRQERGQQLAHRLLQALRDVVDVVGDPAEQLAAGPGVDVAQREPVQLVLHVPAQRGDRALHDAVEQPALQVRQQRRRHVDRHDEHQHPPERGEVHARAGHDVLRLDQGRCGVVSRGARVGRRLGRREAGGQPAAEHAGEDDVRRVAQHQRSDDVERDAGDAEDEHDDDAEPLGRQAAQQPARGRAEGRGLLRGHPDARPRRPATAGTALCGHAARGARGLVGTRRGGRGSTRCGAGAPLRSGALMRPPPR